MASLTDPNPIDNTSPNRGSDLDANFDICKSNDDALNSELATKANASTVDQRTTIQTGTGHAPAGTPVKMSWFEATSGANGRATVLHGLGLNILAFDAYFNTSGNTWVSINTVLSSSTEKFYSDTRLELIINGSDFFSKPVRFLVWHK